MKAIIVEDESIAARKLTGMLAKTSVIVNVEACLDSVRETVRWLENNPSPDLGFFDIQLSDATSFEIFDQYEVKFPVVFITAYDDYLLQAFDHNAIHYLLKPIAQDKVEEVLLKVKHLQEYFVGAEIRNFLHGNRSNPQFRKRLIVQRGMDQIPIPVSEIAYFFSERKITFARTNQAETYLVTESISALTKCLDPSLFFRLNRQYLANIRAIKQFRSTPQSKLQLELFPQPSEPVIVSKEKAVLFRQWIKEK